MEMYMDMEMYIGMEMLSAIKMYIRKKKKLTHNVDKGSSVTMQKMRARAQTHTHTHARARTHARTLYQMSPKPVRKHTAKYTL